MTAPCDALSLCVADDVAEQLKAGVVDHGCVVVHVDMAHASHIQGCAGLALLRLDSPRNPARRVR